MSLQCSAFVAVLFLLLIDVFFMQHLQSLVTPNRFDGYMLLWKLLVALKESVSHNKKSAVRVIGRFVRALLKVHFFKEEDYVTTAGSWQVIARMAPDAMSFLNVSCGKWSVCDLSHCRQHSPYFDVDTKILELPKGVQWIEKDEGGAHDGWWRIPCSRDRAVPCVAHDGSGGECGNIPMYRRLTVYNRSEDHFVVRFEHGCQQRVIDAITEGPLWFNSKCWAVWGGIFKFSRGRSDCCYVLPHKRYNRYIWVRFNSWSGRVTKDPKISGKNCIELLFVRPPRGCWCKEYNDWSMRWCTKCKGQAHERCIQKRWPRWQRGKWTGKHCGHEKCKKKRSQN